MVTEMKETLYNMLGWPLSSSTSSVATAPEGLTDATTCLDGVEAGPLAVVADMTAPLSQGEAQLLHAREVLGEMPTKTNAFSNDKPPVVITPMSVSIIGGDHTTAAHALGANTTLVTKPLTKCLTLGLDLNTNDDTSM